MLRRAVGGAVHLQTVSLGRQVASTSYLSCCTLSAGAPEPAACFQSGLDVLNARDAAQSCGAIQLERSRACVCVPGLPAAQRRNLRGAAGAPCSPSRAPCSTGRQPAGAEGAEAGQRPGPSHRRCGSATAAGAAASPASAPGTGACGRALCIWHTRWVGGGAWLRMVGCPSNHPVVERDTQPLRLACCIEPLAGILNAALNAVPRCRRRRQWQRGKGPARQGAHAGRRRRRSGRTQPRLHHRQQRQHGLEPLPRLLIGRWVGRGGEGFQTLPIQLHLERNTKAARHGSWDASLLLVPPNAACHPLYPIPSPQMPPPPLAAPQPPRCPGLPPPHQATHRHPRSRRRRPARGQPQWQKIFAPG